ncbi:MAG: diguanylate cyclase [Hydrogenovibrio sp.]|uniref:GGDEF domain-containing response regulator n=1 Tax=Hydrogenovibrio sp. TaxID=2065821 RepID=UPI00286FE652|nr:diguanylate cyclase [Hydrogenovibrio sp.]MDR9498192.1 diguanylate cyclase [Hydrogenovibrio sp.]
MTQAAFLIIEDQASIAGLLKSELARLTDAPIEVCHDMAEARTLIDSGRSIAVCLTGLQLPDSHENEIIHLLKAHHIPTVVLTGTYKEATRQEMFELKVADYVIKESIASIRYAVQMTHRLYHNAHRHVWLLGHGNRSSARLLGMLRTHRYQVRAYDCTRTLLADLKKDRPNLLVLDGTQTEPGNHTFDLINALREHYLPSQLPIIACESSETISNAIKLMKYGVNDFYNTSFTPEEFYVRVNQNIEQAEVYHKIERLSQRDSLTGLYNRRTFFAKAEALLAEIRIKGGYFFALMADIDHFKQVNDNYGHQKGDDAIVYMAQCLSEVFSDALVGRFGGEEFCVIGKIHDTREAEQSAETLRARIEADAKAETGVAFTLSQGMTFSAQSVDEAVQKADDALYRSKENGRNQVNSVF